MNLELVRVQRNINPGYNEELNCRCPLLEEYTKFVEQVKNLQKEDAIR